MGGQEEFQSKDVRIDPLSENEVVEVSEQNKLDLFKDAIKATQKARPETEHLLSELQRYDHLTTKQLKVKDETILKVLFRLLSNGSKSFVYFIALSYCWHSGQPLKVSSGRNPTGQSDR